MNRADNWATPQWLFDSLDAEFGFVLDAAAESWNAKVERFLEDALEVDWGPGPVWLNPPYGGMVPRFLLKVAEQQDRGITTVCLLPGRPDAPWWHDTLIPRASEIRFLRGRIAFVPPPNLAMSPRGNRPLWASIVAVFRGGRIGPPLVSSWACPKNSKAHSENGQREFLGLRRIS